MSLVKWFRKNNKKIMAIFVIGTMVSFLGVGQFLNYVTRKQSKQTVYTFKNGRKITNYSLNQARQELEILQTLKAQQFLQSTDLRGLFLSELLFSERNPNPILLNYVNQIIQRNGLRIRPEQISGMYQGSSFNAVYWILLKAEAADAGMGISNQEVGQILNQIIPQLFPNASYGQLMTTVSKQWSVPENEVLRVYGDLLNILQYARLICSLKDVTYPQMKLMASTSNEPLDTEFVKLSAQDFVKLQDPNDLPNEATLTDQFNRYKSYHPGEISADNPFGFGYRLPDRVQIEYLIVKLADVQQTIPEASEEVLEEYYQRVASTAFSLQVPKDPNDPNSPTDTVIRPYAEVASEVKKRLSVEKTLKEAEDVLQKARSLAQFPLTEDEAKKLTLDEIKNRVKDANAYYPLVAEKIKTSDVNIPVYTGTTGLLSREEMQADRYLMQLHVSGPGKTEIPLTKVLFTIEPYTSNDPALLTVSKPWLYNTIGPARSTVPEGATSVSGHIMALVRVVAVAPAAEPNELGYTYNNTAVHLDGPESPQQFVLEDKVIADVKKLKAFHSLPAKAEELIKLAQADNWKSALKQFNQTYGADIKQNPTDPNIFTLQTRQLSRASAGQLQQLLDMALVNPLYRDYVGRLRAESHLADQLYAIIPPDQNEPNNLPQSLTSESDFSVYCVKRVSVSRLNLEAFDKEKAQYLQQAAQIASQSLAPVHFNPDNILKRMQFKKVKTESEDADTEDKAEIR